MSDCSIEIHNLAYMKFRLGHTFLLQRVKYKFLKDKLMLSLKFLLQNRH